MEEQKEIYLKPVLEEDGSITVNCSNGDVFTMDLKMFEEFKRQLRYKTKNAGGYFMEVPSIEEYKKQKNNPH